MPEAISGQLSQNARSAATRALLMARESLRVSAAFEAAGLAVMIVKGTPLAILAYGDIGIKESWDIDVLIARDAVVDATRLLETLGYGGDLCPMQDAQLTSYAKTCKEAEFHHARSRLVVELHWDLLDNPRLLRGVGIEGPAQDVAVPGGSLRTLADPELFAYLCAHGATHNWARLKWLADLAALVARRSEPEREQLFQAAQAYGVGRAASVALRLCERLMGLEIGDRLRSSLDRDRMAQALERNVLAGLAWHGGAEEHRGYSSAWLRTLTAQVLVAPGASNVIEQLRFFWHVPVDRAQVPLPHQFAPLYHLLRVPLWLGRVFRRALGRKPT